LHITCENIYGLWVFETYGWNFSISAIQKLILSIQGRVNMKLLSSLAWCHLIKHWARKQKWGFFDILVFLAKFLWFARSFCENVQKRLALKSYTTGNSVYTFWASVKKHTDQMVTLGAEMCDFYGKVQTEELTNVPKYSKMDSIVARI
jgi:hypothetical protein